MTQPVKEIVGSARVLAEQRPRRRVPVRPQRFLYHATPESNVESIMSIGLQPRAENPELEYDPCIHLTYGIDRSVGISRTLRAVLLMHGVRPDGWSERYRILRIDRKAIPDHRFWVDHDARESCITDIAIPPGAIASCGSVSFGGAGKKGALSVTTYHPELPPPQWLVSAIAGMEEMRRRIRVAIGVAKEGGYFADRSGSSLDK